MPTFNAGGDDAARRVRNLQAVVADAQASGYAVETVWIVTDLPGSRVRVPASPDDGPVSVPVHAARAPRGTHDWDDKLDVGEAMAYLFGNATIRECQISHHGPACPPGPCQHPERDR